MTTFFRKLWPFVRPYQFRLLLGLFCGVLIALLNLALVVVIRLVANTILGGHAATLDESLAKLPEFLRVLLEKAAAHLPEIDNPSNWQLVLIVCLIPVVMLFR